MTKYVKNHEAYIKNCLNQNECGTALLNYHHLQILNLQHERLIHLIVTGLVTILLMVSFSLLITNYSFLKMLLTLILMTLDCFYLYHYYFLENSVQRWYKIENQLIQQIDQIGTNSF